jgi:type II secretory pathway pseudopilin PulG
MKRNHDRRRPRGLAPCASPTAGFTLVELMISVFLLVVGILGVSQVFAVSNRHTANARLETVANSLIQEIREKVMSENFDDIYSIFNGIDTDVVDTIPVPATEWAEHVEERLGEDGRGTVTIQRPEEDASLPNGMVRVSITVSWYEGSALVEFPMEFLVAKIGA